MADLWYYTQEGRAQDPVTKRELQQLAGSGLLKPNDLVWTEGMPQWIRASVAGGLFAEDTLTGTGRSTSWDSSRHSTQHDLVRRSEVDLVRRQPRDEDDRTEVYDDAYEQPARRRRGLSTGAKAGIIAGVVVTLLLVVGIVILIVRGGGSNTRSFSLAAGQSENFQLPFKAGNKVEIWVKSTGQSDVDLYVYDANNRLVEFDDGDSSDCYVRFLAGKNQTFRVEVKNERRREANQQWRNGHNSGTLTFKEGPLAPGEIPPDEYTNRQPWFMNPANRPGFNPGGPFNPPGIQPPGFKGPGFKRPNRPPFNQRP